MSPSKKLTTENSAESIEALRKRYEQLNTRRIQADRDLENAREQLQRLQEEAVEKFGSSDPDVLQARLKEMQEENERRRIEYQSLLDRIEADLQKVDDNEHPVVAEEEAPE